MTSSRLALALIAAVVTVLPTATAAEAAAAGTPVACAATDTATACASPPRPPPDRRGARRGTHRRQGQSTADAVQYSWPGVYFEGRFRGTGVGIVLNDSDNDYDVAVDGATVATLVTPGRTTYWVRPHPWRAHRCDWSSAPRARGPPATSAVSSPPPVGGSWPAGRAHRQIEFIGDSFTVGYGNLSTRATARQRRLARNTDADLGFGALTARRLNADYQINAYSGLGMVRNYNGGNPEVDYRTYYDRALLASTAMSGRTRAPGDPNWSWSAWASTTSPPPFNAGERGRRRPC